jgi:hypothetical protein
MKKSISSELAELNSRPEVIQALVALAETKHQLARAIDIHPEIPVGDLPKYAKALDAEVAVSEQFPETLGDYHFYSGVEGELACEYVNYATSERLKLTVGSLLNFIIVKGDKQ